MFLRLLFLASLCLAPILTQETTEDETFGEDEIVDDMADESVDGEDEVLDEDDEDVDIEDEEQELRDAEPLDDGAPIEDDGTLGEDEDMVIKASPEAKVHYTFPRLADESSLPGGKVVKALIGFQNIGESKFIIDNVEGSFRYPQDYNYIIQNFTAFNFNTEVSPGTTQTFLYMFVPSEQLAGGSRTFTLVLSLNYRSEDGTLFTDAPFNETISVYEVDEGFDTEIFFLYILLAAIFAIVLFGAQYMLSSAFGGRKTARKVIETGTDGQGIDYDYIPRDHLSTNPSNKKGKTTKRE